MDRNTEQITYKFIPDTRQLEGAFGRVNALLGDNRAMLAGLTAEDRRRVRDALRGQDSLQDKYKQTDGVRQRYDKKRRQDLETFSQTFKRTLFYDINNRLPGALSTAGDAFGAFAIKGQKGMTMANVGATALAATLGVALVGAIAAAGAALFAFHRQFVRYMDDEAQRVGRVSLAMTSLGINREQARAFDQETERLIAITGRNMPVSVGGINAFYTTAGDEIATFLKSQGTSLGGIQSQQVDTSTRLAILTQMAGVDMTNARANIASYLGGAGAGELKLMTLFANSPRLREDLENGIRNGENRTETLIRALNDYITDDMIQELQGTSKATLSAFMDTLFDPTFGVFSIARDLEPEVPGYQSVATEFGQTLKLLFGPEGLFGGLDAFANGGEDDPMIALREGVRAINEIIEFIIEMRTQFRSVANRLGLNDEDLSGDAFAVAGEKFADWIIGYRPGNTSRSIAARAQFRGSLADFMGPTTLADAIALELANKPAGSNLVIANDSEVVLTREQFAAIRAGAAGGGGHHWTLNFYQQPGQSNQALADVVIAEIERRLNAAGEDIL